MRNAEKLILTAAHCVAHKDNGLVEKMECMRIRVPKPEIWDKVEENLAREGKDDPRFYDFILDNPDSFHFFPDYLEEGNPNTGDDFGFIQIPTEKILPDLENLSYFWKLFTSWRRKRIQFSSEFHKGTSNIKISFPFRFFYDYREG